MFGLGSLGDWSINLHGIPVALRRPSFILLGEFFLSNFHLLLHQKSFNKILDKKLFYCRVWSQTVGIQYKITPSGRTNPFWWTRRGKNSEETFGKLNQGWCANNLPHTVCKKRFLAHTRRRESGMRGESGSRLGAGEPLCTLWPLLGLSTPLGGCRGGCCGSQHPSTLPGGFLPLSPQSLLSKQSHLSPVTPHQSQKLWIQKLTNHTAKCILHICLWARPPNMIIQILTPSLEGFPADISIKWLVGHTKQRMHWFDHPEVHKDNFFAVTANCRDSLPRPPSPSTTTHRFPA